MTTRLTQEDLKNSNNPYIKEIVANRYRYTPEDSSEKNNSLYLDVARGLFINGKAALQLYETTYQEPWEEDSPHCQKHFDELLKEQLNLTENELTHLKRQYSQKPLYIAKTPIMTQLGKSKFAEQPKKIPLCLPSFKNPRYFHGWNLFRGYDNKIHLQTTLPYECLQDNRNNLYEFGGSVTSTAILEDDTFVQHDICIRGKKEGDVYEQALVACYQGKKNPFMHVPLKPASLQKAIRYQKFDNAKTSLSDYWRQSQTLYLIAESLGIPAAKKPGSLWNPLNWALLLSPAYRQWRKDHKAIGSTSLLNLLQQTPSSHFGGCQRLQNILLQFTDAESPLSEGAFIHELTRLKQETQPKHFLNVTSWYGEEKHKRQFYRLVNQLLESFCQEYEKKMSYRVKEAPRYLTDVHKKTKIQLGKIEKTLAVFTKDKNPLLQKLQNKHKGYCSALHDLTTKKTEHKTGSPESIKQLQELVRLSYQAKVFLEETRDANTLNRIGKGYCK